jgi:SAM-dependent methyltransferase
MSSDAEIIRIDHWLDSPPGQYALAWTEQQLDKSVVDAFGFHALQLGLQKVRGLRCNRMPQRWLAVNGLECAGLNAALSMGEPLHASWLGTSVLCEFDQLPFPSSSIDLVVMPHTLELAADPHATLAEAARVLRPEGRVVIVGFNPASLWGLKQAWSRDARLGWPANTLDAVESRPAEYLGYRRVRDWLRLLSFDIEGGRFGLWRPPFATERNLERVAWMDRVGSHWWPVLGGVYVIDAVKRVRGMRLVGLAPARNKRSAAAPAVAARQTATSSTAAMGPQARQAIGQNGPGLS